MRTIPANPGIPGVQSPSRGVLFMGPGDHCLLWPVIVIYGRVVTEQSLEIPRNLQESTGRRGLRWVGGRVRAVTVLPQMHPHTKNRRKFSLVLDRPSHSAGAGTDAIPALDVVPALIQCRDGVRPGRSRWIRSGPLWRLGLVPRPQYGPLLGIDILWYYAASESGFAKWLW